MKTTFKIYEDSIRKRARTVDEYLQTMIDNYVKQRELKGIIVENPLNLESAKHAHEIWGSGKMISFIPGQELSNYDVDMYLGLLDSLLNQKSEGKQRILPARFNGSTFENDRLKLASQVKAYGLTGFETSIIIVIFKNHKHWLFLVVDHQLEKIFVFDSQPTPGQTTDQLRKHIYKKIGNIWPIKYLNKFVIKKMQDCEDQGSKDIINCGVFMLGRITDLVLVNRTIMTEEEINYLRYKFTVETEENFLREEVSLLQEKVPRWIVSEDVEKERPTIIDMTDEHSLSHKTSKKYAELTRDQKLKLMTSDASGKMTVKEVTFGSMIPADFKILGDNLFVIGNGKEPNKLQNLKQKEKAKVVALSNKIVVLNSVNLNTVSTWESQNEIDNTMFSQIEVIPGSGTEKILIVVSESIQMTHLLILYFAIVQKKKQIPTRAIALLQRFKNILSTRVQKINIAGAGISLIYQTKRVTLKLD